MKTAAFFDMDGTLLRGESQFTFLIWLKRRRLVRFGGALRVLGMYSLYLSGISSDARKLRKAGFGLLKDNSDDEIRELGEEFFASCLAKRLRRLAVNFVEGHRAAGHQTVLLTSAADVVACPVTRHFRFDALIATQLEVEDGKLTGAVRSPEPFGEGKREMVKAYCQQNNFHLADCFAYTDHHSDVPLLELVGHPIAVNPTRKLQCIAETKKWPIVDLDSLTMPTLTFQNIVSAC